MPSHYGTKKKPMSKKGGKKKKSWPRSVTIKKNTVNTTGSLSKSEDERVVLKPAGSWKKRAKSERVTVKTLTIKIGTRITIHEETFE